MHSNRSKAGMSNSLSAMIESICQAHQKGHFTVSSLYSAKEYLTCIHHANGIFPTVNLNTTIEGEIASSYVNFMILGLYIFIIVLQTRAHGRSTLPDKQYFMMKILVMIVKALSLL